MGSVVSMALKGVFVGYAKEYFNHVFLQGSFFFLPLSKLAPQYLSLGGPKKVTHCKQIEP